MFGFFFIPSEEWEGPKSFFFHVSNGKIMLDRYVTRRKGSGKPISAVPVLSMLGFVSSGWSVAVTFSNVIVFQCKIHLIFVIGIN